MSEFKDQMEAFKASARFYLQNRKQYNQMKQSADTAGNEQILEYLHEDLEYVESTLKAVLDKCGPGARLIVYKLFVEGKTQGAIAVEYGMTRRQLQYSLNKWMKTVFEGDISVH